MRHDTTARILRLAGNHAGAIIVLTKLAKFSLATLDDVEALRLPPTKLWHCYDDVCGRSLIQLVARLSSRDHAQLGAFR